MGLKSGSRDAGLDEDEETESVTDAATEEEQSVSESERKPSEQPAELASETEHADQRPAITSIPYKLRRENVNEGREQVPYFLREEIIEAEDEL